MNMNGVRSAGWLSVVCVPLLVILFEVEPALGQATLDPNPPSPWIEFGTDRLPRIVLAVAYGTFFLTFVTGWLTRETLLRILVGAALVGVCAVCGAYFLADQVAWEIASLTFIGAGLIVALLDPVARMRRWEQRLFWGV